MTEKLDFEILKVDPDFIILPTLNMTCISGEFNMFIVNKLKQVCARLDKITLILEQYIGIDIDEVEEPTETAGG